MPPHRPHDPILRCFGLAVRSERKRQRISQEQLALLADLNRTYMGGVERGEENISLKSIAKIAAVLQVKPSALLSEGGM